MNLSDVFSNTNRPDTLQPNFVNTKQRFALNSHTHCKQTDNINHSYLLPCLPVFVSLASINSWDVPPQSCYWCSALIRFGLPVKVTGSGCGRGLKWFLRCPFRLSVLCWVARSLEPIPRKVEVRVTPGQVSSSTTCSTCWSPAVHMI